ncbi:MAG TPA: 50S ribosomal protein L11 methyltransferase [Methylophilaceae bacterium]|nr:50S ribosomal protein L11 methyltransferase [Methylophilaceae bacterium]HQR60805.1 50S ribosomal protein L11 methyltransferase [Methylophilaceae bacterium]
MSWQLLKIEAGEESAEILSDALMELGALSVSIEDADAATDDELPIFGEPGEAPPGMWHHNVVSALLPANTAADTLLRELEQSTGLGPLNYAVDTIAEQDWVRATQSQFEPIRVRDNLWIVPSWHAAPNPAALNIVLDPGLAFGTGSHPTTHLCLAWLADHLHAGESVLDYGCGSGILAIAAKRLGADNVLGTDIDPQAMEASHYNADNNRAEVRFVLPDKMPAFVADVVVANILASPLKVLAPALAGYCRHGGRIVLSGILREQAEDVSATYAAWFDMHAPVVMENWVLLTGTKR